MIERAAAGAGLELKAHPYMLRHGCGYALANKGPDTRAILGWLGHLSITKTAVYTALAPNRFKDFWVSQLGRSFSDLRLGHRGRESFARLRLGLGCARDLGNLVLRRREAPSRRTATGRSVWGRPSRRVISDARQDEVQSSFHKLSG
jgi:hypothetical protein